MGLAQRQDVTQRYQDVSEQKAGGATYTPEILADFVAAQIVSSLSNVLPNKTLRILEPAVGDGALLLSLLDKLEDSGFSSIEVDCFETDPLAATLAERRLQKEFPNVTIKVTRESFLEYVLDNLDTYGRENLFSKNEATFYDAIIANPPYVRTQIIGAEEAQNLAGQFGLSGRVDLYHAFLIGMAKVMKPGAIAGIIVSNRFMTTKSGASVRQAIRENFFIRHVWDLGDTKLFDAAVLPAVLLVEKQSNGHNASAKFTSIYETESITGSHAVNVIDALDQSGDVTIDDGRCFHIKHGRLDGGPDGNDIWRVATSATDAWIKQVVARTWGTFQDIGKIRVGVKTCADKVFIRSDWDQLPEDEKPELLLPLITHHGAQPFRAPTPKKKRQILYPHISVNGQRTTIDLDGHPKAKAYLEKHRATLEARKYVLEAGRRWYELWVPQDPDGWRAPKLVFRDITEKPVFWVDVEGAIVNGDCYWLSCDDPAKQDLLWLAVAVANSTFIEAFYDHRFNNKLYAGRRRFITQYVEQFPLPDPQTSLSRQIIEMAKRAFDAVGTEEADKLIRRLNILVWDAFGLTLEETGR